MSINVGRYYDREYFRFDFEEQKDILEKIKSEENLDKYSKRFEGTVNGRSAELLKQKFSSFEEYKELFKVSLSNTPIKLKTIYPGLLIGSGTPHECGIKHEFKLGLSFDYTTGLPYIPASSVKGTLRSVFPSKNDRYKVEKREFLQEYLKDEGIDEDINDLEKRLFESKENIFFDAYIISTDNISGKFLEDDYITPHGEKLFKNPIPIRFLKIAPEVTICFQFKLETKNQNKIKEFFEDILLEIGIGAKTNVGYGQFKTD